MEIFGYVVYAIGSFMAVTWFIGIRSYTARGVGVVKQTVNTAMLFIVSLVVVPALSLSPLHLLWMFPASFIFGALSLVFPLSLLSIPGQVIFHVACIGLDHAEVQNNHERMKKLQSIMIKENLSAEQAKALLVERGEWLPSTHLDTKEK